MKGILFKENLFRAVLAGVKTETRRIVKTEKPRYWIGEKVYLKEPYVYRSKHDKYFYKFDYYRNNVLDTAEPYAHDGWKNKLFMPEKAARHFIEITNVKRESLQEITRSSIRREGLVCPQQFRSDDLEYNYKHWYIDNWVKLWDKINGKDFPWSSNPDVWVYQFKILKIHDDQRKIDKFRTNLASYL